MDQVKSLEDRDQRSSRRCQDHVGEKGSRQIPRRPAENKLGSVKPETPSPLAGEGVILTFYDFIICGYLRKSASY